MCREGARLEGKRGKVRKRRGRHRSFVSGRRCAVVKVMALPSFGRSSMDGDTNEWRVKWRVARACGHLLQTGCRPHTLRCVRVCLRLGQLLWRWWSLPDSNLPRPQHRTLFVHSLSSSISRSQACCPSCCSRAVVFSAPGPELLHLFSPSVPIVAPSLRDAAL